MFCVNCGNQLNGNESVCPNCGKQLSAVPQAPVANVNQNAYYPASAEYPVYRKPKDKLPTGVLISLCAVSFLFVLFVVIFCVFMSGSGNALGKFNLYCESVPEKTEKDSIILEGTIRSSEGVGTLMLNGEVIETVSGEEKSWNEAIVLKSGINEYVLTFSDEGGNSATKVFVIEKESKLVYPVGTVFVKSDPAGVYIRPTPEKSEKYVIMLQNYDYTSELVCLGEEHTDAEGYLWCKVTTPQNGPGWVRTDLVKVKN